MNTATKAAFAAICALAALAAPAQDAARREAMLKMTGGLVEKGVPANAPVVVVVDGRKAPDGTAEAFARRMSRLLMLPIRSGSPRDGDFVIEVADGGDLVVMPESRKAVVPAGADAKETERRLSKALVSLFAAAIDPVKLDGMQMMLKAARDNGVPVARRVSYRQAVKEGWAPAPTNEYQKAIWDAAHTNAPAAK